MSVERTPLYPSDWGATCSRSPFVDEIFLANMGEKEKLACAKAQGQVVIRPVHLWSDAASAHRN